MPSADLDRRIIATFPLKIQKATLGANARR
jgi:hypothetical protein